MPANGVWDLTWRLKGLIQDFSVFDVVGEMRMNIPEMSCVSLPGLTFKSQIVKCQQMVVIRLQKVKGQETQTTVTIKGFNG
jgi:hypothetical protein